MIGLRSLFSNRAAISTQRRYLDYFERHGSLEWLANQAGQRPSRQTPKMVAFTPFIPHCVSFGRLRPNTRPCSVPSILPSNTPGALMSTAVAPNTPTPIPTSLPHCTIGIGHLVHEGPCNGIHPNEQPFLNSIDDQRAQELFRNRIGQDEQTVRNLVAVPLNQYQFDALVSFVFNTGRLSGTDLLTVLNQGSYDLVPEQMRRWNLADLDNDGIAQVSEGLTRRREFEITLFRDGIYRTDW